MSASSQFNFQIYNYAVGWWNRQPVNPLTFIAPIVRVPGQMGTFKRYSQGGVFRAVETRRARLTPYNAIDIPAEDVPYLLEDRGLRIGVDDRDVQLGAGDKREAANQIAQSRIGSLLGTYRTSMIASGFEQIRAGVTATTSSGDRSTIGSWSGSSADPMADLREMFRAFAVNNGIYPNRILFGRSAWDTMANNSAMLDLVTYNDAKVLTPELLVKLLDITDDVAGNEVQIMRTIIPAAANRPGPGVAFSASDLIGDEVWITYAQDAQDIGDPSGLKTLSMAGEDMVETVKDYYVEQDHATWYEVAMAWQTVVTAPTAVIRVTVS